MKSHIFFACLMVIMSVSTVAQGEILDDGDGFGDGYGLGGGSGSEMSSSATGGADGDNTYGYGYGEGWHEEWTTVRAVCYEECYVYAWTEAQINDYDFGYCSSCAYASAGASGKKLSYSYSPSVCVYEYDNPPNDYDGPYDSGTVYGDATWYDPGEGISGSHSSCAYGSVEEGSDAWTFSHACARAYCYLHEI